MTLSGVSTEAVGLSAFETPKSVILPINKSSRDTLTLNRVESNESNNYTNTDDNSINPPSLPISVL